MDNDKFEIRDIDVKHKLTSVHIRNGYFNKYDGMHISTPFKFKYTKYMYTSHIS